MKNKLLSLALALGMFSVAAPASAGIQDFSLYNHTGLTIQEIYVSESDDTEWGEDVLEKDTLADSDSIDIEMSGYKGSAKMFDLKIIDDAQKEWIVENIDLSTVHSIVIRRAFNHMFFEQRK